MAKKSVVKKQTKKTSIKKPVAKTKSAQVKKLVVVKKASANAKKDVSKKKVIPKGIKKSAKAVSSKANNKKSAVKKQTKLVVPVKKSPKPSAKKQMATLKSKKTTKLSTKKPVKKAPARKAVLKSKPAKKPVAKVSKVSSVKTSAKSVKSAKKSVVQKKIDERPVKKATKATKVTKVTKISSKKVEKQIKKKAVKKTKLSTKSEKTPVVTKEVKKITTKQIEKVPAELEVELPPRSRHQRHSVNIYFSLEDLDSYFENKNSSNGEHTDVAHTSNKLTATKPVFQKIVKPVVPQAPVQQSVASISDILGFNPVEVSSREKLESLEVPRKWKKYYNILVDMRKRYSQGVADRSEEVLKRSAKEDSGDLSSYGQHLADAGSESYDRDMAFSLLSSDKEIIAEIDAAIERMKNGTYGICEVTGKPIPESRLLSIPFARCTIEGQEIKEQEIKKQKTSQRASFADIPDSAGTDGSDEAGI